MNLHFFITSFLLSLFLAAVGHNIVPHQHESPLPVDQRDRTLTHHHSNGHRHHHHRHHEEQGLLSWLTWLQQALGDFQHADFGEKHLEFYYVKNNALAVKKPAAVALLSEIIVLLNDAPRVATLRPDTLPVRAPDPPGGKQYFGRAPPSLS